MSKTLFSVVIPTYNRKEKLKRAVDSVLNQEYKNWEILVIDNNSKDGTYEMIKNFKNSKIKIFQIKNNGCIAKSRNVGVMKSRGRFVAFLDSDDYWFKNKLQYCYDSIVINPKINFIYHDMLINQNKFGLISKKINYFRLLKNPIYDDLVFNGPAFPTSSVVLEKSYFKKINMFDEKKQLITWEDYDAWIRFSKVSNEFFGVNKALGSYTHDYENTLTPKKQITNLNNFIYKYFANKNKVANWCYYALLSSYFKEKNYKKALHFYKKINFKKLKIPSIVKLLIYYLIIKVNLI